MLGLDERSDKTDVICKRESNFLRGKLTLTFGITFQKLYRASARWAAKKIEDLFVYLNARKTRKCLGALEKST